MTKKDTDKKIPEETKPKDSRRRDEVEEASEGSFPASDPPAFTSSSSTEKVKYAKSPKEKP